MSVAPVKDTRKQSAPAPDFLPLQGTDYVECCRSHRAARRLPDDVHRPRLGDRDPDEDQERLSAGHALGRADLSELDPEKTAAGLIHVTPALRSSVADIRRSVALVRDSAQSLDLASLAITVNIVDSLTTVMVISVPFARKDATVVQEKAQALQTALRSAGLGFYRLGL